MREMLAKETGSADTGDARLAEFLGISDDPETSGEEINRFWQTVEANLRKGDVRLMFVADELPRELRRLIEFLNEQFTNIEVLGVELRQYVGQGIKALVPRVVGQTEAAREQKERFSPRGSGSTTPTTREAFLAACPESAASFFAEVLDEAEKRELKVSYGAKGFSVRAAQRPAFFYCFPPGANGRVTSDIEIFLADLRDPKLNSEMRDRFVEIEGTKSSGKFTIRLPVSETTVAQAKELLHAALEFMDRQRAGTQAD
jgi:hypothetical protein